MAEPDEPEPVHWDVPRDVFRLERRRWTLPWLLTELCPVPRLAVWAIAVFLAFAVALAPAVDRFEAPSAEKLVVLGAITVVAAMTLGLLVAWLSRLNERAGRQQRLPPRGGVYRWVEAGAPRTAAWRDIRGAYVRPHPLDEASRVVVLRSTSGWVPELLRLPANDAEVLAWLDARLARTTPGHGEDDPVDVWLRATYPRAVDESPLTRGAQWACLLASLGWSPAMPALCFALLAHHLPPSLSLVLWLVGPATVLAPWWAHQPGTSVSERFRALLGRGATPAATWLGVRLRQQVLGYNGLSFAVGMILCLGVISRRVAAP